jgi:hypothetical protein
LLTFHKIIAGCEEGDAAAWKAFLADYSPLIIQLAAVYFGREADTTGIWRGGLSNLCAENFNLLRSFEHQSELEFLAGLRYCFLDHALRQLKFADRPPAFPTPTLERTAALLKDLPLVHQEVVFYKLAGYSDKTLDQMLRITPSVAQKGLERLREDYAAILGREDDTCLASQAWLVLVREAHAARGQDCPSLRQFLRIQDGQSGWYDKEPTETHLMTCLPCLEAWTALREIAYWRNAAPPASREVLEALSQLIPVRIPAAKPLFKRILG